MAGHQDGETSARQQVTAGPDGNVADGGLYGHPAPSVESRGGDERGPSLDRAAGVQVGSGNVQVNYFPAQSIGSVVFSSAVRRTARAGLRAYREQLRSIAPRGGLQDRGDEIAELADFCAGDLPYCWFQAEAWAGKSALMSSFALEPPHGLAVVSFFVTGRYPSQNDSAAFIAAILGQLEELLGADLPEEVAADDDLHPYHRLLLLMRTAALACQERGQRLVLVVDGLDEDRSSAMDLPSVAALLPKHCDYGTKVILASRPNPGIPSDVQEDHPLRDPGIIRKLAVSPHARPIRASAEWELRELVTGKENQKLVLGILAAAGGGLRLLDLAELTHLPPYEITEVLRGVTGRTFTTRPGPWSALTQDQVYLLAHEQLQAEAVEAFGERMLSGFRKRLHDWADSYAALSWPEDTPAYLLVNYFQMLKMVSDSARMAAYATDVARHNRILAISGGDEAGLAEVISAQSEISIQLEPDLSSLLRLAMHQEQLTHRNAVISTDLPAAWVALGQPDRAVIFARSLTNPERRVEALVQVAKALAAVGELDRARSVAAQARIAANSLSSQRFGAEALGKAAEALAAAGQYGEACDVAVQAERLARTPANVDRRDSALAAVAAALAAAGDFKRAESVAHSIALPHWEGKALAKVAEAAATAGHHQLAEALARSIADQGEKTESLARTATVLAEAGNHEWAELIARSVSDPRWRSESLAKIAMFLASAGQRDRAVALASEAESATGLFADHYPQWQAWVLTAAGAALKLAHESQHASLLFDRAESAARKMSLYQGIAPKMIELLVYAGERERASRLAYQAKIDAHSRNKELYSPLTMTIVTDALAQAGLVDQAGEVARSINNPFSKADAVSKIVRALAAAGRHEEARELALSISDVRGSEAPTQAMASAGAALMAAGLDAQGLDLLRQAESIARSIEDGYRHAVAMRAVCRELAAVRQYDQAVTVARSIRHVGSRARELAEIAGELAAIGQEGRSREIVESFTDPAWQTWALAEVARALAASGQYDRAENLASRAETLVMKLADKRSQAGPLAKLAEAFARLGQYKKAEKIARSIAESDWRFDALIEIARTLATAGHPQQATEIACSMQDSFRRSTAFSNMAEGFIVAGQISEARRCVAEALIVGPWYVPLKPIGKLTPSALCEITDMISRANQFTER